MASLLAASRMGMSHAWASYCDHLVKRPLITKVITGKHCRGPCCVCMAAAAACCLLTAAC
jgi:hypothetical protein